MASLNSARSPVTVNNAMITAKRVMVKRKFILAAWG